jgi:lipopolysaccharide biosynthesis regulator YciM
MLDIWFIIPLVIAIFIGWLLGRLSKKPASTVPTQQSLSRDYFIGLDHLLNEQTDEAIESFIRALEVNSETIPAHLALAKLFRRKGDVQRAINIHQNLLARPELNRADSLRIQMALALDYDAIGLLDRTENLLKDIIRQRPPEPTYSKALMLLTKLYEKEGEWLLALEAANKLPVEKRKTIANECAHYCCELAEACLKKRLYKETQEHLKRAYGYSTACVRSSLISAKLLIAQEQWKAAIKSLKYVAEQDPLFVSETIKDLRLCFKRLNNPQEYEQQLRNYLKSAPSTSVVLALAELIKQDRGVYAAGIFITDELKYRPSVKGFNRLIDMHIQHGSESARESLKSLRTLTGTLEVSKPRYRCYQCGFSGKILNWQCPSCKRWGTTKPIQGLEGE